MAPAAAAPGGLPDLGQGVKVGRLAVGGTYIVRPLDGPPVAAVELWYRAPSTGFGPSPMTGLARLAAQVVAASKPIVGDSLGKTVADLGGRLSIDVYSDSVSIAATVPADSARDVIKQMTTAYFAPVVTDDGYRSAQRDVAQEALVASFDPETVARNALFAQLFSSGPQHYPEIGTAKGIAAISESDVRSFAVRAFRSQNAVLVVSGAVDASIGEAAATGRASSDDRAEPPAVPVVAPAPAPVTESFTEPALGYGWVGPAIGDEAAATAMDFIADYLFRPDAGYVSRQIQEEYPQALVTGQFITLHDPGVMFVVCSGKQIEPLKRVIDAGVEKVQEPMSEDAFASALRAFKYHLLSDLQTPSQMADNFGWYSVEGNPEYAPGANGDDGAYFKRANALTPEFVASVARRYLGKEPAVASLAPPTEKIRQ